MEDQSRIRSKSKAHREVAAGINGMLCRRGAGCSPLPLSLSFRPFLLLLSFILCLGHVSPVQAHNGNVALALPLEGIVLDGDLSDWPEERTWYPIAVRLWGHSEGSDCRGRFRVGYSAKGNALYVAIAIEDESIVIHSTEWVPWCSQDDCYVFVDVAHKERDSPAVGYGGDTADIQRMRVVQWGDAERRYEWRINLTDQDVQVYPGMVLGFEIDVFDLDRDGSLLVMLWGRGASDKPWNPDSRGDLVLGGGEAGTGRIEGRLRWEGHGGGGATPLKSSQDLDEAGVLVSLLLMVILAEKPTSSLERPL